MEHSHRPIRLLLNAHTIRTIDEVIASGSGGFTSREELVEEALNSYFLELREIDQPALTPIRAIPPAISSARAAFADISSTSSSMPLTVSSPVQGFTTSGNEVFLEDAPMLGLHNRDWPSFWALGRLAYSAAEGPIRFHTYLEKVTDEAWQLSASLQQAMGEKSKDVTRMLPTNTFKKQAADAGFRNFAVGSLSQKPAHQGIHKATGPLPMWRAIAFIGSQDEFKVALTQEGWELLKIVDGLGPEQPHDHEVAKAFFRYLQTNAPIDWWGFNFVLREVSKAPTRDALIHSMSSARDWSPSIASSATQGYIARCREWGLVEPRLVGGTYKLTEFGKDMLNNG